MKPEIRPERYKEPKMINFQFDNETAIVTGAAGASAQP